jgi:hypothetical protein
MYRKYGFETKREVIPRNLVDFLHRYLVLKSEVSKALWDEHIPGLGIFNDPQVPNTWCCYADIAMETLLSDMKKVVEGITGEELLPTYSFVRVYKKGDILKKHIDRPSCAISCTLNIGGDAWPISIKGLDGVEQSSILNPGDLMIYRGDQLQHWRDPFEGDICSQVFLHYNPTSAGYQNLYDGRQGIGFLK